MTKKNTDLTAAGTTELSEGEMHVAQGGNWKVTRATIDLPGQATGYQTGGTSGDVVRTDQLSLNYEKIRG